MNVTDTLKWFLPTRKFFLSALLVLTLSWTNTFLHDLASGGLLSDAFVECERSIENLVGSLPCRISPHFHSPMVEPSSENSADSLSLFGALTLLVATQIFAIACLFEAANSQKAAYYLRHIASYRSPPLYILKRALLI